MKTKTNRLLTWAAVGILLSAPVAATGDNDWPIWSGPHRNLTASGDGIFERPGFALELLWSRPLGSGYSGISVVGDRLVTAFADGESDFLIALDAASGDELWRYRFGEMHRGEDAADNGPLATPMIHGDVVYGLGPRGRLVALRLADGGQVWSRQLVDELGARKPHHGFTSSPTVIAGVLVMQTGGADGHAISGLDPQTGELLWSAEDDAVLYQSPTALPVAGEQQVFAVTNRYLLGLRPKTGEVLWKLEHRIEDNDSSQAVPVSEDSVLVADLPETILVRVTKADGGYRAEEVWRSRAMRDNHTQPVPREGYIYGFSGRFLTCADAASGETVWKSRQPGGGGGDAILVDSHLVILASNGDVVVAKATPEGYQEEARVGALERGYLTRPSFAGGRIFVRNLSRIASIGVSEKTPPSDLSPEASRAPTAGTPEAGLLGELAAKVRAAENKRQLVDDLMAAHADFPILDGDLVHFVYRGEVEGLGLTGNMLPAEEELPMHRLEGTDLHYRTLTLEPDAHFEYAFAVFDDEVRLDPLNPRKIATSSGERSVLTTRGFQKPAHLRQPEGLRGRIDKLTWQSDILGDDREVKIYLPAGYEQSSERYPLLVVNNGDEALEWGLMDRILDNLVNRSVAPLVVVFVPWHRYSEYGSRSAAYSRALIEELLPLLDRSFRTVATADTRAIMGAGGAGRIALYAALKHSAFFGKVAIQSFLMENMDDDFAAMIEQGEKRNLIGYLDWSLNDLKWDYDDARADSQRLATMLEKHGHRLVTNTVAHGHGWSGWRLTTDRILETLFPLE
ncbi:MAG: PQQ-binding-like beta-propeller repeat protein [bacterium]|nr:PQQ-binding-like beta-propeller repeat protein [bacterium]